MAVTFLDPGGDADFGTSFSDAIGGATAPILVTDFVHGSHLRSYRIRPSNADAITRDGTIADSGARIGFYIYIVAYISVQQSIVLLMTSGAAVNLVKLRMDPSGYIFLVNSSNTQLGSNGPTLSLNKWYRISIAYTITSTTVNRFELFVDGASAISVTNATLTATGTSAIYIGNGGSDASLDVRISDIYVEKNSSLTDPGNMIMKAIRPFANGTLNQFTTQIGAGGSGYGTGHAPQVNERALSVTNGWSIQNAATQTEEYFIENIDVGDFNMANATPIDYMGWVNAKDAVGSVANIIVAGNLSNITLTTAFVTYIKMLGSKNYPNLGNAIGMDTNNVNQLFSLAECGIIGAYKISPATMYNVTSIKNITSIKI